MKKTYHSPAVRVTAIETTMHILQVSNPNVTVTPQGSVNAADVEVKSSTPSYNVWDDDWSE